MKIGELFLLNTKSIVQNIPGAGYGYEQIPKSSIYQSITGYTPIAISTRSDHPATLLFGSLDVSVITSDETIVYVNWYAVKSNAAARFVVTTLYLKSK